MLKNRINDAKIWLQQHKGKTNESARLKINKRNQRRLKNHNFSLISSNCNGAFILHDLGVRFNSPFVNLWMKPKDFLKMLSDLMGYMSEELTFVQEDGIDYPIGLLRDVRVYFTHYASEENAKIKWDERKSRINYVNLFVIFSDRDGCTIDDLEQFDKLSYNKVVFTNKPYANLKSSFYLKGFENQESVGLCYEYQPNHLGRKYYDQFDYVTWFNKNKHDF